MLSAVLCSLLLKSFYFACFFLAWDLLYLYMEHRYYIFVNNKDLFFFDKMRIYMEVSRRYISSGWAEMLHIGPHLKLTFWLENGTKSDSFSGCTYGKMRRKSNVFEYRVKETFKWIAGKGQL